MMFKLPVRLPFATKGLLINSANIWQFGSAGTFATEAAATATAVPIHSDSRPRRIFPRKIVFLGPPGVGKGSYAAYLSEKHGVPHVSTGDIIRQGKAKTLAALAHQGTLLPDDTVNALVQKRLKRSDVTQNGYVLDGYPRTLPQAEALSQYAPPDMCVELKLPEHILLQKIKGRRACKECGHMYNVAHICELPYDMPALLPKVPDRCDKCLKPLELIQRQDDTLSIAQKRLQEYEATSRAVVEYYKDKKCLRTFLIQKGMKDARRLEQVITKFAGRLASRLDCAT